VDGQKATGGRERGERGGDLVVAMKGRWREVVGGQKGEDSSEDKLVWDRREKG
jgi:hypothetical protein